jgi:hypothetical protein
LAEKEFARKTVQLGMVFEKENQMTEAARFEGN